jgi:hypothetical protein
MLRLKQAITDNLFSSIRIEAADVVAGSPAAAQSACADAPARWQFRSTGAVLSDLQILPVSDFAKACDGRFLHCPI